MAISNVQESIATIPLLGMNRAQSADLVPAGSMDEQINLRSYNGSLVPILDSDQLRDKDGNVLEFLWDSEGNYDALETIEKMYIHKTSNYTHYICVMFPSKNQDGTYTETQIYWRGDKNASLSDKFVNFLTRIDDPDGTVRVTFNGNIVIINWLSTDDAGNKTPNKSFFIWKDTKYNLIDFSGLEIFVELNSEYDNDCSQISEYKEVESLLDGSANITQDGAILVAETITGTISKINQTCLNLGKPVGAFTWCYAIRLYDGTSIYLSPIILANINYVQPYFFNYFNYENYYWRTTLFSYFTHIRHSSFNNPPNAFAFNIKVYPYKRTFNFTCSSDVINKLIEIKDLILSIDLYASDITYPCKSSFEDIINVVLSEYKRVNNFADNFMAKIFKDENNFKEEILSKKLYLLKSFDIDDFISKGTDFDYQLDENSFKNINLREMLPLNTSVSDNTSYSSVNFLFNGKNHTANSINSLTRGFGFNKYQEHPFIHTNTNDETQIPQSYSIQGESTNIIGLRPVREYPSANNPLVANKPLSPFFCDLFTKTPYDLFVRISIKGEQNSILINSKLSDISYLIDFATSIISPYGMNNLNPLITFPDSRAYKMEFLVRKTGTNEIKLAFSANLKAHPLIPNMAYFIGDLGRNNLMNSVNVDVSYLTEQNPTEQTQNELTVSNVNNPFVSSDANHYTVGAGKILGLAANTQAITTGQFGQYPLLAFCSDGLYALGQGSGEVDYAFVRPLTRDVVTNADTITITPIDDAIVFATVRGLMMTNGQEVLELSRAIEGKPFDFLRVPTMENNNFDYIDIMREAFSHPSLSGTADEPPKMMGTEVIDGVNFLDYLKAPGTNIGFVYNEHRELIISNPNYSYSYVYSFNSQQFYKISAVYRQFIGDYPRLLGITKHIEGHTDKLIEISNEKASDDKGTIIHFMSRPYTGGVMDYKSAHRSVLRCMIKPVKYLGFYVVGSEDGHIWRLLGGSEFNGAVPNPTDGASVAKEFINLGASLYRTSCRYFRFACVGVVEAGTKLDYIDFSCAVKSTGKLM